MRIDKSLLTLSLAVFLAASFATGCRTARNKGGNTGPGGDIIGGGAVVEDGPYNPGDNPLDPNVNFQSLERATDVGEYYPVYFQYDSSMVPPEEASKIAAVAELLKATRKRRIAAGAGVQVQEVNRLLKEFEQMQDMMKKMKGGGLMKMMKRMGGMKGMGGGGGMPGMPF